MRTFVLFLLAGVLLLTGLRHHAAPPPRPRRAVVYLVAGDQLLVMQKDKGGQPRAKLELPRGKIKAHESPLEAARRECLEESGLRITELHFLTLIPAWKRKGQKFRRETWAAFWGHVPDGTPPTFAHEVSGQGGDRGRLYHYRLLPLDRVEFHSPLDVALPALRQAVRDGQAERNT